MATYNTYLGSASGDVSVPGTLTAGTAYSTGTITSDGIAQFKSDCRVYGSMESRGLMTVFVNGNTLLMPNSLRTVGDYVPLRVCPYANDGTGYKIEIGASVITTGTTIALRVPRTPTVSTDVVRLVDMPGGAAAVDSSISGLWKPGGTGTPTPPSIAGTIYYGSMGRSLYFGTVDFTTVYAGLSNGYIYFDTSLPVGFRPSGVIASFPMLCEQSGLFTTRTIRVSPAGSIEIYAADGTYISGQTIRLHPFRFSFLKL